MGREHSNNILIDLGVKARQPQPQISHDFPFGRSIENHVWCLKSSFPGCSMKLLPTFATKSPGLAGTLWKTDRAVDSGRFIAGYPCLPIKHIQT